MDITLDVLRQLNSQHERNDAYTESELKTSFAAGVQAACNAIEHGEKIMIMDESSADRMTNAFAGGWNFTTATKSD